MGSMSVSSCRCCMFVSCVYRVAVLNAALCMTCSLLMLTEDARGVLNICCAFSLSNSGILALLSQFWTYDILKLQNRSNTGRFSILV